MDWSFFNEVSHHLATRLPSFGTAIVLLFAARILFLKSTLFKVNQGLLEDENPATGLVFAAYLFGAALALVGTMFGRGQEGALAQIGKTLVEGGLAIVLLRLSIWVNDRFILHRFCIVKEVCEDKNLGVGFCVAGSCIACGLILNGALTGYSKSFVFGLRDIVIFWLLGQVALVVGSWVYHRITRYDVHQLIEYDDNTAVGIGFGAFLAGLGLVVRASLVGAGLDAMGRELPRSLLLAAVGILGVIAVHAIALRLVTTKVNYEDEVEMHGNVAVSIVSAGASLAAAMLFAVLIQR
jgi:uncharacterized membrane protein YjfL (UPF0719 family)